MTMCHRRRAHCQRLARYLPKSQVLLSSWLLVVFDRARFARCMLVWWSVCWCWYASLLILLEVLKSCVSIVWWINIIAWLSPKNYWMSENVLLYFYDPTGNHGSLFVCLILASEGLWCRGLCSIVIIVSGTQEKSSPKPSSWPVIPIDPF
jgi:hypothetical protein